MRTPDATLIRARARAPLRDLQALHLSSAGIECIRYLDASARSLRSLYADDNRLKNIDGVLALRRLWRIDLTGNQLHGVHAGASPLSPLASFTALGFLHLERNQLEFQDLACLRDVHIMELRAVEGNPALVRASSGNATECRRKTIALLSNVWMLDGHYVATTERQQALDEFDGFAQSLLDGLSGSSDSVSSGGACDKFGSTAKFWGGVGPDDALFEQNDNVTRLVERIDTKRVRSAELEDRHRLRTIVSLHNDECAVHNAHCRFAPSKFSRNAHTTARIPLPELLAASPQVRIEVAASLAAYIEFAFARELLIEALVIVLLECPSVSAEELAALPPYAMAALLSLLRHHTLEEAATLPDHSDQVVERTLWTSLPPLFATHARYDVKTMAEDTKRSIAARCAFAVALLSRATSFPDNFHGVKRRGAADAPRLQSALQLIDLVQVAQLAADDDGASFADARNEREVIVISTPAIDTVGTADAADFEPTTPLSWSASARVRESSSRPWGSGTSARLGASPSASVLGFCQPQTARKPRVGEWVEVRPKQFVKVQQVAADGAHVVGRSPTDASVSLTLRIDHLSRVSSSLWRLSDRESAQLRLGANVSRPLSSMGKLHRDSEGFHRHGAARNQGFPNHFVTSSDLVEMERPASDNQHGQVLQAGASEPSAQSVALFSSNDTLDANFVLAPPPFVSAQNYCAMRSFRVSGQSPAGLWSPIKHASFTVLTPPDAALSGIPSDASTSFASRHQTRPTAMAPSGAKTDNEVDESDAENASEWTLLRREMERVLHIKSHQNVLQPPSASALPRNRQPQDDVLCFLTTVPPPALGEEPTVNALECATELDDLERSLSTSDSSTSSRHQAVDVPGALSASSTPPVLAAQQVKKRRVLGAPGWHRVPPKPQLLVSSSSVPVLGMHAQPHQILPTSSQALLQHQHQSRENSASTYERGTTPRTTAASRTPMKIPQCHVVLPVLAHK